MNLRISLALAIALAIASPVFAETIVGRASVIDGDTLDIRGRRIRLHGIDAPESSQLCQDGNGRDYRCGQRAALALSDKIGAVNVTCERRDTDRYGRMVATCSLAGESLNGWLVRQGHALAYRQYGGDAYAPEEKDAQAARRGIWAGSFTLPWDWRKGHSDTRRSGGMPGTSATVSRQSAASGSSAADRNCLIKGNINRKGERIYHVPGSRWYDRTVLNTASGERWFCTEEEARSAGWRAPLR